MFLAFQLETLEWKAPHFRVRISVHRPIQEDRWDVIWRLETTFYRGTIFEDWDPKWAALIDAIGHSFGSITQFVHSHGKFGPQSHKALSFHFNTLVRLQINGSNPDISAVTRAVLCSCPKLEYLLSGNIFARDVVQDEPWVCQSLRVLMGGFRVGETEQDLQPLIFERLSSLTRLTVLNMNLFSKDPCDEGVLNFRLDCGLGQLATLKKLASVTFPFPSLASWCSGLGWKMLNG